MFIFIMPFSNQSLALIHILESHFNTHHLFDSKYSLYIFKKYTCFLWNTFRLSGESYGHASQEPNS